jgi:hypothetical protein
MKIVKNLSVIFVFAFAANVLAQTNNKTADWEAQILSRETLSKKEFKSLVTKFDFSSLWTRTNNASVYGFIGNDYQRLRIKIISVRKDKNKPDTYTVFGKSIVRNNINRFSGTIKITKARIYKIMHWGVDDEYKNKGIRRQGVIIAGYNFLEDQSEPHSGIFNGRLATFWYIDKNGNLKYDDIEKESDSYSNNQFVGTWKGYKNNLILISNWGDYRIPLSGNLDVGAGEFSPDDKYLKFGWQTYRDAYFNNNEQAKREEERVWWK